MPTYQYQCTECGNGLEAVQKFTDEALTTCPDCQGRLRKVFSAVGVVFKGSGFYRTDSRSSSSSSVGSSAGSSTSSTTSGSSSASGPSSSSSASNSSSSSSSSSSPAPAAS
ncbi:FmdB family transcriptional regulator [Streptomyces viridifaciens]|uniref:FmdB family zinc ribbon protein n=1 Tax=Kitasatospora aureofaciens TaxID=1894 RepID=UPI000932CFD5|nr:FmdB family transcriptional regulator [Streptomyces viridifaciens]UKZ06411.1 FmdB family transcriptional regulator [Streptomyces viridifaciens]